MTTSSDMRAVVLAGGKGRRLQPYTTVLPKPLMPVGDEPILEIIVRQLREAGCSELTFAVGHLAELIEAYFGSGERFGVSISYSREYTPLGTAGPLGLLPPQDASLIVMNGDILTDLDFRRFATVHRESGAAATVAVYTKHVPLSLGVLDIDDERCAVVGYREKPTECYRVSTGIYCLRPDVLDLLEPGVYSNLPDLILELIERNEKVHAYDFDGCWLDIGTPEDYEYALNTYEGGTGEGHNRRS